MRIDAYAHVATDPGIDALEAAGVSPDVVGTMRNMPHLVDLGTRLADMDRFGIDRQVLTYSAARALRELDPETALPVVRVLNDEVRRLADAHPDRFIPVGTIPWLTDGYVDEFERCVEALGMAGVQIYSNIEGRMLDDPAFEPFFAAVDAAGTPLWLHPQLYDWHDYETRDIWLYKMMGWPFDTSVALGRLVLNGVLDRHENVRVIAHHLGGALPYWEERLLSWVQSRTEDPEQYHPDVELTELSQPVEAYFERIYGDTAVSCRGKTGTLRCGYDFFGPENVLFGVDYPYGPHAGRYWYEQTIPAIESMAIPDDATAGIFGGNAARLLGL